MWYTNIMFGKDDIKELHVSDPLWFDVADLAPVSLPRGFLVSFYISVLINIIVSSSMTFWSD